MRFEHAKGAQRREITISGSEQKLTQAWFEKVVLVSGGQKTRYREDR